MWHLFPVEDLLQYLFSLSSVRLAVVLNFDTSVGICWQKKKCDSILSIIHDVSLSFYNGWKGKQEENKFLHIIRFLSNFFKWLKKVRLDKLVSFAVPTKTTWIICAHVQNLPVTAQVEKCQEIEFRTIVALFILYLIKNQKPNLA